jgi:hypothetical protein
MKRKRPVTEKLQSSKTKKRPDIKHPQEDTTSVSSKPPLVKQPRLNRKKN